MRALVKLATSALLAGGLALGAAAPAQARVDVGIGIGIPGPYYHHDWCYYHPYRCGGYPRYAYGAPYGYYHHDYWRHRRRDHDHWRYWR